MIKILSFIFLAATLIQVHAQEIKSTKKSQFGFYFGLDYNSFNAKGKEGSESLVNDEFGLSLGIIGEHKLSEHFFISPKFELSLNRNKFSVTSFDQSYRYDISPVYTTFKTDLVYKLSGLKARPYFLVGPSYSLAINEDDETYEFPSGSTFSVSVGVGLEKKYTYLNLAPELRYTHGLSDMNENPVYNGQLYWNRVSLVLYFKG